MLLPKPTPDRQDSIDHGDVALATIAGGCQPVPLRMPLIAAGFGASKRQITSKPAPLGVGSQFAWSAEFEGRIDWRYIFTEPSELRRSGEALLSW